jgi:hypothetical protein
MAISQPKKFFFNSNSYKSSPEDCGGFWDVFPLPKRVGWEEPFL